MGPRPPCSAPAQIRSPNGSATITPVSVAAMTMRREVMDRYTPLAMHSLRREGLGWTPLPRTPSVRALGAVAINGEADADDLARAEFDLGGVGPFRHEGSPEPVCALVQAGAEPYLMPGHLACDAVPFA